MPYPGITGGQGDAESEARWAVRYTITQATKIDGKWADKACPRCHQLPRPDGHRLAVLTKKRMSNTLSTAHQLLTKKNCHLKVFNTFDYLQQELRIMKTHVRTV